MRKAGREGRAVPSPLLSIEQVETTLVDELVPVGWDSPNLSTTAGPYLGARFGRRLRGEQRVLQVLRTQTNLQRLRNAFSHALDLREWTGRPPGATEDATMMVAVIRAGRLAMTPCVVQVIWWDRELHLTAHAKEGPFWGRTCEMALTSIDRLVG